MNKIACIIAEYHPFHSGHAEMIRQLHLQGYCVVAVMSGNFVQRGTPALLPKQVRTAAALSGGVDLVIELPCAAAAASAPRFAAAGVAASAAIGAELLVFGAEDADLPNLQKISALLRSSAFSDALQQPLKSGLSFAAARSKALEQLLPGSAELIAKPNNILAIEYLTALQQLREQPNTVQLHRPLPRPLPYARTGAGHDGGPRQGIASAGWLRSQPVEAWQPYVPATAFRLYQKAEKDGLILCSERWEQTVLTLLRCRTREQLATLPDLGEGLDAVLYRACRNATGLEELYTVVKSKRYAHARIRRAVLAAAMGWFSEEPHLFGITSPFSSTGPLPQLHPLALNGAVPYLRVLGANTIGRSLLGEIAAQSPLPVSPSLRYLQRQGHLCDSAAAREAAAGDLYALCLKKPLPCGEDYRLPLIREPSVQ